MKFKKSLFWITLVMAVLVFFLGIFLGEKLDQWRVGETDPLIDKALLEAEAFIVESDFLDTFGVESCEILEPRINALSRSLYETGTLLKDFDQKKMWNTDQYTRLKKKHYLNQIKAISLNKKIEEVCGSKAYNVIYFFGVDDEQSDIQGSVLDTFVVMVEDAHIFSFDGSFDDPSVNMLKKYFNVTNTPTIIWGYEEKLEGLHYLDGLLDLVDPNI